MAQPPVIIATLAIVGALGGLTYVYANRDNDAMEDGSKPAVTTAITADAAPSRAETPLAPDRRQPEAAPAQPSPAQQIASTDVERWIADAQSNDAKKRAEAIEALANAPKARAIPALERVLESGEPQVDRQIALRSLHRIALKDGDDNGAIRDVIRHAIYHSDDEGVTQSAQAFLEDIEAALDDRAQSR
jgi:HEAT repeat protein